MRSRISEKTRDGFLRCGEGKDLEGIVSQLRLTAGVGVAIFIYEMETQLLKYLSVPTERWM